MNIIMPLFGANHSAAKVALLVAIQISRAVLWMCHNGAIRIRHEHHVYEFWPF